MARTISQSRLSVRSVRGHDPNPGQAGTLVVDDQLLSVAVTARMLAVRSLIDGARGAGFRGR